MTVDVESMTATAEAIATGYAILGDAKWQLRSADGVIARQDAGILHLRPCHPTDPNERLERGEYVAWVTGDGGAKDTVVVWAGNDADPDMNHVVSIRRWKSRRAPARPDATTGRGPAQ